MASLFTTTPVNITGYARIVVERSVDRYPDGLTYAIPEALADLAPGERVIVPLGKSNAPTPSYVIDISAETDIEPEKIKPIERRDKAATRLPKELMILAKWISGYYCAPLGMTLASMLPAAVKRNVGSVSRTYIDLSEPPPEDEKLPPKQKQVIETLQSLSRSERPIDQRRLAQLADLKTPSPIKRLIERGLLRAIHRTSIEAVWTEHARDAFIPDQLTPAQQKVINDIAPVLDAGFSTHLLYGVTGSGKTEVYIRLIHETIARGRTALMLVPEISLTPQTGGRLIGRFPDHHVAVLHSGLTQAQRHQQWALAAEGKALIILGARSAIFAPIPDAKLGLIIVDEEHDGSYKQDQVPRYHGRDVAIRRAQLANCPILLGSATPSMESWHNATRESSKRQNVKASTDAASTPQPTYKLHTLTERVPGAKLPQVHVVDFIEEQKRFHDRKVHLIGPRLLNALQYTLENDAQALILLNRRGYANYIACPDHHCGWVMTCNDCDVTVVYHINKKLPRSTGSGGGGFVRCHHCLTEQKLPPVCPQCGKRISTFGLGTQRVEEELARELPELIAGTTMLRMDSDTMHGSRDFHDALTRFGRGEIKLLVGTQMIAKGLDFPGVRLVGVINADTSIHLPDFRASERTFQLVSQVAGRSGRSVNPGQVIVQTFNPGAPAIRLAAQHDFVRFAEEEIAHRKAAGLPPVTRMTRIVLRDADHIRCMTEANALAASLRELSPKGIRLRGPAPCPIARIAGKHRQQIELFAPNARIMQELLAAARSRGLIKSDAKMAVDVDPIALL